MEGWVWQRGFVSEEWSWKMRWENEIFVAALQKQLFVYPTKRVQQNRAMQGSQSRVMRGSSAIPLENAKTRPRVTTSLRYGLA